MHLVWGVHVKELLHGLLVLHLVVGIAAAQRDRGRGHIRSGVLASISGCVVPIPVNVCRGGGWGGWVARLSIAVTSSDAMSPTARLALRGIVDHICELGLRRLLA
jgi:hypothetical protein